MAPGGFAGLFLILKLTPCGGRAGRSVGLPGLTDTGRRHSDSLLASSTSGSGVHKRVRTIRTTQYTDLPLRGLSTFVGRSPPAKQRRTWPGHFDVGLLTSWPA